MFPRENDFNDMIAVESTRYGVPVAVIKATIATESGFNPKAYRAEPKLGDASRGLMQVLGKTARALGFAASFGDDAKRDGGLFDPWVSIQTGTAYLAQQRRRYPSVSWDQIYAAYNAGSIRFKMGDAGSKTLINESAVRVWRKHYAYYSSPPLDVAGDGEPDTPRPDPPGADGPADLSTPLGIAGGLEETTVKDVISWVSIAARVLRAAWRLFRRK